VLAATRVALETQPRPGFDFKSFDFIARALFQYLVTTPGSLISFTSHCPMPSPDLRFVFFLQLRSSAPDEHKEEMARDARKRNGALR
jgi:hypothetical protein